MRLRSLELATLLVVLSPNFGSLLAAEPPTEIPFKLYAGFAIVVRGAIGSQDNVNILVDTGAVPSVVHQRLARKLRLQSGSREVISVVNQNHSLERVSLVGLRLGSLEFPTLSAVVLDLAAIESRLGVRLDAIVGLDLLGHQNFTIDYRRRRLLIGEALATGEPIPFELQREAGAPYIVVPVEVNSLRVRLLLDTGADNLTLYAPRVQALTLAVNKSGTCKDVSAAGEYAVDQIRLSNARLGGIQRPDLMAAMVDSPDSALRDFDGLFGPAALGITRLGFDFRTNTLYVELNR
jgi:predicted aspartyl protease